MWTPEKPVNTISLSAAAWFSTFEPTLIWGSAPSHCSWNAILNRHAAPNAQLAVHQGAPSRYNFPVWENPLSQDGERLTLRFHGAAGLTGVPPWTTAHTVPPTTRPAPIPIAQGESKNAPVAGTYAPATRFSFFYFCFSVCRESSRVVFWPCASVVGPASSLTLRSPFRAAICTRPSTSLTSNSVQTPETGETVTLPTRVASSFEVEMLTPPCSNFRSLPSYWTRESLRTRMLEPVASMLATESAFVCTKSPENRAEERAMLLPLSSAVP